MVGSGGSSGGFFGSREPPLLIFTTHLQLNSAHLQLSSAHSFSAFCTSTAARLVATCTLHFALVQFDAQWYQLYHVGFCISHKSNEIAESLGMLRSCFSIECKLEKLVSLEIQSKNCKLFGVNHHFQNPRSAPGW